MCGKYNYCVKKISGLSTCSDHPCTILTTWAVCCRVLQRIAVCCIALQCVAVQCSALKCVAVCFSKL